MTIRLYYRKYIRRGNLNQVPGTSNQVLKNISVYRTNKPDGKKGKKKGKKKEKRWTLILELGTATARNAPAPGGCDSAEFRTSFD